MLINEALSALPNFNYESEIVSINEATQKRLAKTITATKNLPSFDNSALDGYAIKYADKNEPLIVTETILAGDTSEKILQNGTCMKIMTGAKIPKNADTIIPFEDAIIENERLIVSKKIKQFNAIRLKGEEVKIGEILIKQGEILNPAHIMLLASQGIFCVQVYKQPRICIYSSGNEIIEPWLNANEEQIYNANAFGIKSLLANFGFYASYKGIIKDDLQEIKECFLNDDFDVLLCSGGASAGEADYMKTALISLGFDEIFDNINIKPGRPTKAFLKDKKVVFVLPGNPMAAFIMAFLIIIPFLKKQAHKVIKAKINQSLKIKSGRVNLVLGSLNNGEFLVTQNNQYGSGMITPLTKSDAFYLTKSEESEICSGDEIFVYKFLDK
ncbi:MAG: molybdopterin molybdotransferase MoeA [Campylobacter sp.]